MIIAASELFGWVVAVMGIAAGIELGLAFLMRTTREVGGTDER